MPKIPNLKTHDSPPTPLGSGSSSTVLRRNQACHQCRRKKLKCDAQAPCAACVKSHAYALKTHPATVGSTPDCVYDDPVEAAEGPNAKFHKLEEKISRLEALLTQKQGTSPGSDHLSAFPHTTNDNEPSFASSSRLSTGSTPQNLMSPLPGNVPSLFATDPSKSIMDLLAGVDPTPTPSPYMRSSSTGMFSQIILDSTPLFMQLIDPSWPSNLPSPELLNHLIETFFNCVPHANRVLHRPTFMSSMINHPSSEEFPHIALLHAICSVASLYTPMINDQPENDQLVAQGIPSFYSGVIRKAMPELQPNGTYKKPGLEPIDEERLSFGLLHARLASQNFLRHVHAGDKMIQLLQAMLIVGWYHYSTGRAVDVWICVGTVHHLVVPLGLNTSEGFTPVSYLPASALTLHRPEKGHVDAEQYRMVFWLCYATERLFTAGSVWPLCLNDEDISQIMPIRLIDFMAGHEIPVKNRQTLMTSKMLITHPPETTDAFTLYIKGTILIGKVKTFNIRFKMKYGQPNGEAVDPRDTSEFQQLENLISAFKLSFPQDFKKPISEDGKVDPTLYMSHLLPHISMILLHDPHADMISPTCFSAAKIRTATRAILDLIYKISATTYDLLLMDHAIAFCWLVCGTALIRFLKAHITTGNHTEAIQVSSEFDIVKFMLGNLGERTVLAHRQIKLLDEMYKREIGNLNDHGFWRSGSTGASLQEV